MLRLDVRETRTVATIACDGKNLFYNSDWVSEVQSSQLMTAIARLVLSCALKHHIRRKERIKPKWNEASRLVTLPIVKDAGLSTSREGERDKTAEQVYSELPILPKDRARVAPSAAAAASLSRVKAKVKDRAKVRERAKGSGQGQGQEEGDGNGGEGGGGEGQGQEQGEGSGDVACECSDPNGEGTILDSPSLGNDAEMEEEDQEWSLAGSRLFRAPRLKDSSPRDCRRRSTRATARQRIGKSCCAIISPRSSIPTSLGRNRTESSSLTECTSPVVAWKDDGEDCRCHRHFWVGGQ